MRPLLTLVLLCSMVASALGANQAIVIRDDGYYVLPPGSTQLVKVGCIIDQRANPGDPTPTPTPEDPDTPTARAKQIATLSKDVGTHEEAIVMATVARTLADQGAEGKVAWDTAFVIVLNRSSGNVPPVWADWKNKVDALADKHSSQFFSDVAAGISIARGLDTASLAELAELAEAVRIGIDPNASPLELEKFLETRPDVSLGLGKENIDIARLLQIIMLIFKLLGDLGIL